MRRNSRWWVVPVIVTLLFIISSAVGPEAWARAGGGRSFGGGSYRSFSSPYSGFGSSAPWNGSRAYQTPSPSASPSALGTSSWGGGGFMRSLAGGLAGGFLGSLLFSGLGFGGGFGGVGGGGIGPLEILLFAGITLAVVAYLRRRNSEALAGASGGRMSMHSGDHGGGCGSSSESGTAVEESPEVNRERGLVEVAAAVPDFDAQRFPEEAMDIFFRIQGAWARRDLPAIRDLVAPEVQQEFQRDIETLKAEGKINRLENITVRRSEIHEAWMERGRAFVTIHFLANLLDYTVDERSGNLVGGSNEVPVKFEEYWTFARPAGGATWQLTAIQQAA